MLEVDPAGTAGTALIDASRGRRYRHAPAACSTGSIRWISTLACVRRSSTPSTRDPHGGAGRASRRGRREGVPSCGSGAAAGMRIVDARRFSRRVEDAIYDDAPDLYACSIRHQGRRRRSGLRAAQGEARARRDGCRPAASGAGAAAFAELKRPRRRLHQSTSCPTGRTGHFAALQRFLRSAAQPRPRVCELCSRSLGARASASGRPGASARSPARATRARFCSASGGAKYKRVPRRVRFLTDFRIHRRANGTRCRFPSAWRSFSQLAARPRGCDVSRARQARLSRCCRSTRGTTFWTPIHPFGRMEPDVEALLVNRVGQSADGARRSPTSLPRAYRRVLPAGRRDPRPLARASPAEPRCGRRSTASSPTSTRAPKTSAGQHRA